MPIYPQMRRKRWQAKNLLYSIVLIVAISSSIFFYIQYKNEKDKNSTSTKKAVATTTPTTTSTTTTSTQPTTTSPETTKASVDIIALNNDSNKTTERINTDFKDQVTTNQISSSIPITQTVIVVNNPKYQDLADKISTAIKCTLGDTPTQAPVSQADIVVYVAN